MAIWDLINSTTEAVKQHAPPVPATVKQACGASYNFGGTVVNAVRSGPGVVYTYIPDEQTRSQIGVFAYKLAQNSAKYALRESYKLVPGGKAVAEIIGDSVRDYKLETQQSKCVTKKVTESVRNGSESPGDVLTDFMKKEFIGNRFADDLLLPQMKHGIKKTEKKTSKL